MKNLKLKKVLCAILAVSMLCSFALVGANAKTIVRGDVNGDGKVQTSDARLALRGAAGLDILEGDAIIAADVDEDGTVKTSDARVILRVAAGLEIFENPEITVEEESTDAQEPSENETTTEAPSEIESTTEEPTTEEPTTEEPVPAVDEKGRTIVTEYPEIINSLFNKKFYLDSVSEINGETAPMTLAMNGKDIEVITNVEGQKASMMVKSEKNWIGKEKTVIYMKMVYDGEPCYLKLDESTLKLLGMEFDIDSITEAFNFGTASDYKHIVCYNEELDGTEYTVYSFVSENDSELCFYFDADGNVKYMNTKNSSGQIAEKFDIGTLSATLPSDSFSLDGYKELNILEMLGSAMK